MSQAVTVIPTTGTLPGLTMVQDINAALDCLLTNNSGATAPAQAPEAYQTWADTTKKNLSMYIGSSWRPMMNINSFTYQSKTATYAVVAADFGTFIDATSGTWSLTLTAAATLTDAFWVEFKNSGTGLITIDPNGAELIDGLSTLLIYPGQSIVLQCTGSAWRTISRNPMLWPIVTKSGSYTVVAGDLGTVIQCTNSFTLSLTAAATLGSGFVFGVQNSGSGNITIDPNSTETIDGATTEVVNPGETRWIQCDGTAFRTVASTGIANSPSLGQTVGHVSVNNAVTPNTKIDVTWASVIMVNSSNLSFVNSTPTTVTIDASVNAAVNRLDTGSLTTNTWYYIWIISNGSTTGALLSLSSTAPTMPSGYTYKTRAGSCRTDGSSVLYRFRARDRDLRWTVVASSNVAAPMSMVSPANTQTRTAIATGNFAPPTASRIQVIAASDGGANHGVVIAPNNDAGYGTAAVSAGSTTAFGATNGGGGSSVEGGAFLYDILLESTNIYYSSQSAAASNAMIAAYGFTDAVNC